jgi:sugar lactone lactonase YvrE
MKKTLLLLTLTSSLLTIHAQTINTVAGTSAGGYSGNGGQATAAELSSPYGVTFDASGSMYIADFSNMAIRIVNTSGIISTFAGNHISGFSGDGGQATAAELTDPGGVTINGAGNLIIADFGNQRVRLVNSSGIITTIAGNGTIGSSGDGGPATAAELHDPFGTAIDAAGNIYIADYQNSRIRIVNTSGIINTFAGNGLAGYGGDGGQATAAKLYTPTGVALDAAGNVYIADYINNRVRMVNTSGIITTIAGIGLAGFSGDGGPATAAEVSQPTGVIVDPSGNIYEQEWGGDRVRRISAGIITTLTGTGVAGFSGDGGPSTAAQINSTLGLALDASNNLYIADVFNNRIRKVSGIPLAVNSPVNTNECNVYPNPTSDNLIVSISKTGKTIVTLYDITGREMLNTVKENTSVFNISVAAMPAGIYLLKLQTEDGSILTKKIEVAR